LFPTECSENSEWIVAWHHLQSINKALQFLREFVAPNTAAAVMTSTDIAKKVADAADVVQERLKKFPQDRCLLKLPELHLDSHDRVDADGESDNSDQSSEDGDEVFVIGRPRPRPVPAERPELWQHFEGVVQFVMDSCAVNRRAATDALFAHNRNPERAIAFLLQ
jgi:hypothetical protein